MFQFLETLDRESSTILLNNFFLLFHKNLISYSEATSVLLFQIRPLPLAFLAPMIKKPSLQFLETLDRESSTILLMILVKNMDLK